MSKFPKREKIALALLPTLMDKYLPHKVDYIQEAFNLADKFIAYSNKSEVAHNHQEEDKFPSLGGGI